MLRSAARRGLTPFLFILPLAASAGETPRNLFEDPCFEMGGAGPWRMDKGKGTTAEFKVDEGDAFEGKRSALVTVEATGEWGVQFGQIAPGGQAGKTYTFAAFVKSVGEPTQVQLEIERSAKPWDRAVRTEKATITKDKWTELHATFKVEKPFAEGWFAYVSCNRANVAFRVDAFRLYEGDYVPFDKAAKVEAAATGVSVYEMLPTHSASFGVRWSKKLGIAKVAEGPTPQPLKAGSHAVLANDRVAVEVYPSGPIHLHSLGEKGPAVRATLRSVPLRGGDAPCTVTIASNTPAASAVEVDYKDETGKPAGLRVELKMGQVFVETQPRGATAGIRLNAASRFAVLPDFFADDIVVDATELPVAKGELPSENFLLHLRPDQQCLVMAVWNVRGEDVEVTLAGEGMDRQIASSEIRFGEKGRIWVAALDAPGIWHVRDVAKDDAGKIVKLDWKPPFPAQWRMNWRREDGLADSWEIIAQRSDGNFVKHWLGNASTVPRDRKRWTTVFGSFLYPCWIDRQGEAFYQPLSKPARWVGPAIIYPLNQGGGTPLDRFTVLDIVRNTLGVRPCEYILDVEGQQSQNKGRATCANRDFLNPIYQRGEQKKRRDEILRSLDEVMVFVRYIRERIGVYVDFGHELLKYLAAQKQAHPELAERIAELEKLTKMIDEFVAKRRHEIKTPDEAQAMVDEFRKTMLDYEGPDAFDRCKKFTAAIVVIGGSQDELVGEGRLAVKLVRQRAGLLMAIEPRMGEIAKEVRARAQKVLRSPAGHEGARH
ncbi:MAG: hypothetical protein FJ291_21065 [Planctomycetes bacterium]|nr:hypothetical protein [Planctomycetota bacterium]